jgi:hypothetical protein
LRREIKAQQAEVCPRIQGFWSLHHPFYGKRVSALAKLVARGPLCDALDHAGEVDGLQSADLLQIIKHNGTATEFMKGLLSSIDELAGVVLKEAKQGRVYVLVP